MADPFLVRQKRLHAALRREGLDGLLLTHLPNILYLTGFTGSNACLFVGRGGARFFTDGRYTVQAGKEVRGARLSVPRTSLLTAAGELLRRLGRTQVAVEAEYMTLAQKAALQAAGGRKLHLRAVTGMVEAQRSVKDAAEVRRMAAAARLICRVFDQVLPQVKPGIREIDLAAEIEHCIRRLGGQKPAFETIVASGPRAALPHARPTSRRFRRNELVVLDMGAILDSYCSDLTRTVYLGRAPRRIVEWYGAVWEAHRAAREAVRPGIAAGVVDKAARAVLGKYKLDKYFTHSTGHGLGLEIHEFPRLARGQKEPLRPGQVITIEPGIYIEGVGGIRIEDDVLVTPGGSKVLTRMCGELLQI
jgi:Xaa-Pro aminopeptidase